MSILEDRNFEVSNCDLAKIELLDCVCVVPWRPAKGSLRRFPAALAAANAGSVATLVVGRVRTARPPWPPMEPAILRGMSRGCPRDPVWAIIPVIRVARLSWVST